MKLFRNLPIRTKLIISHGQIALMALAIAVVGMLGTQLSSYRLADIQSGPMAATEAVGDVMYTAADLQLVTTTIVSLPASKEDLMPSLEKNMADDVALMDAAVQTTTLPEWGFLIAFAALSGVGAWLCFTLGIKHTSALQANFITMSEPVMAPIWTFLFLGEKLPPLSFLGCAFVIGTLLIYHLRSAKHPA